MKIVYIKQDELPELIDSIKTMINKEHQYLYKIKPINDEIYFYVKAVDIYYMLSITGKIIDIDYNPPVKAIITNTIYFSDIEMPRSVNDFVIITATKEAVKRAEKEVNFSFRDKKR